MEYRLSDPAREDLVAIWAYSDEVWGPEQADRYQEELFECIRRLASDTPTVRRVPGLEEVVTIACREHRIFARAGTPPLVIVAVLHQRLDMISRLKDRL